MSLNSTCDMVGMFSSWIEPYNATYSFCGDAARQCGGGNTTSKMVFDYSFEANAQRELFYFYTEQMGNDTVLNCFNENAPNATIAWAAGAYLTTANDVAISSGYETTSAATANCRARKGSSLLLSIVVVTVIILLLGSSAGVAAASTPPYASAQEPRSIDGGCEKSASPSCGLNLTKRQTQRILCHQFVPNGPPTVNFTKSFLSRGTIDCEDSPVPCYNNDTEGTGSNFSGEFFELLEDGPNVFFAEDALKGLFNATLERQYSGTLKRYSEFVTLSVPAGSRAYISASRLADQYDGELRRCDNGRTYRARYTGPRDDMYYRLEYRS